MDSRNKKDLTIVKETSLDDEKALSQMNDEKEKEREEADRKKREAEEKERKRREEEAEKIRKA